MKKAKQVKGIFFDAGGTLFETKQPIGRIYSQIAAKYGVEVDSETLDQKFKTAFRKHPPLAFPGVPHSELLRLEFAWWHKLVRSLFAGIDFPRFDLFFEELYSFFEGGGAWRLFPETKEVLEKLQKDQCILGIISNFDSRLIAICKSLGILDYFKVIVFSSEAGRAKPDPAIFEMGLERAGLASAESIFVGDHPEHDIKGSIKIGMTPILIDRLSRYPEISCCISVSDLTKIYPFIKT